MASLTRWTWVSVNSGSWWWTGRPGVLRFMGSQRVGHHWVTDLIWSDLMEFIKVVMMTLYARQQKRHRCKEQTFGLCGRRQGWDDLREWHWNMYIIICETDRQSRFDAWDRVLRAGTLGWPSGMGWVARWVGGSGGGTHVHSWLIHVNVWQKPLQYCKVISFQLKLIN